MSAPDDRQTHPPLARARWRKGCRHHLHWRPREVGDFLPKRHHRASRELHQRRLFWISGGTGFQPVNFDFTAKMAVPPFRRYNFQTVSPPTIVLTARPFSFQPSKVLFRTAVSN